MPRAWSSSLPTLLPKSPRVGSRADQRVDCPVRITVRAPFKSSCPSSSQPLLSEESQGTVCRYPSIHHSQQIPVSELFPPPTANANQSIADHRVPASEPHYHPLPLPRAKKKTRPDPNPKEGTGETFRLTNLPCPP
ncbi:uncharacterized protein BO66DRAFT_100040 [Aspergillus aculeatinus CBS 121060]|uniref:Uncharacterized protein n=1 Tax=Aspergillus aculeatinus CBS 121060 TaxID=1448322 RepID=A0ACD1H8A3_9EURO|nr:hypothetical protein BO66DRAFT_100040 [Aspergillus aculeatinus CBS 121060]RAH69672.1 hypothetical protein BO66DRAFT_100040 [Aspergillus aculeatinus CBS 121060]